MPDEKKSTGIPWWAMLLISIGSGVAAGLLVEYIVSRNRRRLAELPLEERLAIIAAGE